jgi:hypothetical protein
MQPIVIFEILLLVAIVAGIFVPWDARSAKDRRESSRGGRRTADGTEATDVTEPTSS